MASPRVALITGATSGIGLGIARALAKEGFAVAFNGLGDPALLEGIRIELEQYGSRAMHLQADARDPVQLQAMVHQCEGCFDSVDVLVNCAGVQHVAPIEEFPVAQWDVILAINLSAAFHTIRTALPGMRRRNWGRIVNIASVHGLVASAHKSAYVAAKHGLIGLTKAVALETADSAITCNALCPGWVHTPLVENQIQARSQQLRIDHAAAQRLLLQEKQPSLRFVEVEQIAALTVFLCGAAASEVRGAAWTMDGGWTAQ